MIKLTVQQTQSQWPWNRSGKCLFMDAVKVSTDHMKVKRSYSSSYYSQIKATSQSQKRVSPPLTGSRMTDSAPIGLTWVNSTPNNTRSYTIYIYANMFCIDNTGLICYNNTGLKCKVYYEFEIRYFPFHALKNRGTVLCLDLALFIFYNALTHYLGWICNNNPSALFVYFLFYNIFLLVKLKKDIYIYIYKLCKGCYLVVYSSTTEKRMQAKLLDLIKVLKSMFFAQYVKLSLCYLCNGVL